MLIIAGTAGSFLAASAGAHSRGEASKRAFDASSAEIAAVLGLAVQHEEDLVVSIEAFILGNPDASHVEFVTWANMVHALDRYPELQALGEAVLVPASGLRAFEARVSLPSHTGSPHNLPFVIVPPGHRAFYCFSVTGVARHAAEVVPPGYDLCQGSTGQALLATRRSGLFDLEPLTMGKVPTLSLGIPIYAGGSVPATVTERTRSFVGWVGVSLIPEVMLETALDGHPNMEVALRYQSGSSFTVFRGGAPAQGASSLAINLHRGWTVETYGTVTGTSLLDDANALALVVAGFGASVLLGLLVYLLGTGRARAMVLVGERTEELEFQALHDPLTKLPNRALILDRVQTMLLRARRSRLPTAAMFLDLDDFKDINDTLGHHVGDRLLVEVSSRLTAATREGDTVGRLGGDEFILLVEGASLDEGLQAAADRILGVLAMPFRLTGTGAPLQVSASIGIAAGDRDTADELLRDADIALYLAKAGERAARSSLPPSCRPRPRTDVPCRRSCARHKRLRNFFFSTSPLLTSRLALSPGSRRSCAGGTLVEGLSNPTISSLSSKRVGSSSPSAPGSWRKRAAKERLGCLQGTASPCR